MTTFYISSSNANKKQVTQLSSFLKERGARWVFGYDWSDDTSVDYDREASKRILSCVSAQIFIALQTEKVTTEEHVEFGARLACSKEVHLIGPHVDFELFTAHQCVIRHTSPENFLAYLYRK